MRVLIATLVALMLVPLSAGAQSGGCYADYKAKQDNPLRLHYGVVEVRGECSRRSAAAEIAGRIARDGWTLLNVVSVFDASGLPQRRESAGPYYLRY